MRRPRPNRQCNLHVHSVCLKHDLRLSSSKSPLFILKLFVNRIRPRAGTAETRYTDTLATAVQERREAALRERGLLPPLQRNKDRSRRERERDQHLPIIEDPLVTIPSPSGAQSMTPANQIKKEWEAQKRIWEEEERERLNRFRFGTQSTSVNETQAHGQPSSPLGASTTSVPAMLALSGRAPADEDTLPPTLSASGASKHRTSVDDSTLLQAEYPTDHLPTLVPITPLPVPLHASVSPLPPQTSAVIQAGFEPEPPWCPAITPVPLETTPFQEDAASPERQRSDSSCLVSSVSDSHTSPAVATPHTAGLPIPSTLDASLRLSSVKDIPTIVESPIEDGLPPEMAILNPDMEIQQVQLQIGPYPKSKHRKRRMVFSEDQSGRRLAISTSLSNMRRSVTSTLMRTRSVMIHKGLNGDGAHDALSRQPQTTELTGTAPRRQAVAPTLHSQGSILLQTSTIEDEEARRVAELAYLG
ncbi:hypothetical protein M378DRAFT_178931 [Amanita muscaria Koide BX008]|uniref:Uncharacterized protein n=1 Tax=Amanita muscaria (strain Koide BX008) TaxID=946122 RepID=A0A0C2SM45_AMAMK|nr:hypothetical protein M378DRAFT_178931 [Amanita muscaria Koide BX008]